MTIKKYKTFEAAADDLWNFNPDENYYKKLAVFFRFATQLNHYTPPRGLFKFRTMIEANEHSEKFLFNPPTTAP